MTRTQTVHLFFRKNPPKFTHRLVAPLILVDPLPPQKKWAVYGYFDNFPERFFRWKVSGISDFFSANLSRRDGWTAKIHKWHSAWRQDASNTAEYCYFCWGEGSKTLTWMSQEVSKWLVNGLYNLLINRVYWGYNPITNHLLSSWDIQEGSRYVLRKEIPLQSYSGDGIGEINPNPKHPLFFGNRNKQTPRNKYNLILYIIWKIHKTVQKNHDFILRFIIFRFFRCL